MEENNIIKAEHCQKTKISWKYSQEGTSRVRLSMHKTHDECQIIAMEGYQSEKRWNQQEAFVYIPFEQLAAFVDQVREAKKPKPKQERCSNGEIEPCDCAMH